MSILSVLATKVLYKRLFQGRNVKNEATIAGGATNFRDQLPSSHVIGSDLVQLRMLSTTLRRSYQFHGECEYRIACACIEKPTGSAQKLDASSGILSKIPINELA